MKYMKGKDNKSGYSLYKLHLPDTQISDYCAVKLNGGLKRRKKSAVTELLASAGLLAPRQPGPDRSGSASGAKGVKVGFRMRRQGLQKYQSPLRNDRTGHSLASRQGFHRGPFLRIVAGECEKRTHGHRAVDERFRLIAARPSMRATRLLAHTTTLIRIQ